MYPGIAMPLVTISRQYASLGDEIGRGVAERLGLQFVDQEVIDEVAQRLGLSASPVGDRDEREGNLVAELVRKMQLLYPATFVAPPEENTEVDEAANLQVIRQVICEVARSGNAVIIGRGSTFMLPHDPGTVHVLVVAPEEIRAERVMATEGLDKEHALQRTRLIDSRRARYVRHFYRTDWLDLGHYDLIINTAHFTQMCAVSLVCAAVADQWTVTSDSTD
ncbi:MAG: cytidylate kinase-like family protein [Acidobacteriaceae bacterium]